MTTDEQRFWKMVHVNPEGCWEWIGGKMSEGYGEIIVAGKQRYAHRVSYELHFREIPAGLFVCHRCDNPGCVRPDHLFLGTHADNLRDAASKGRMERGEQHYNAKLTEDDVRAIRADTRLQREIAEDLGISRQNVSLIQNHKTWEWL
jgi:hypothetical protein